MAEQITKYAEALLERVVSDKVQDAANVVRMLLVDGIRPDVSSSRVG